MKGAKGVPSSIVVCKDGDTRHASGMRAPETRGTSEPRPNSSTTNHPHNNAAGLRRKSRGVLHSSLSTDKTEALTASLTSSLTSQCQLRDSIASHDASSFSGSLRNSINSNPFHADRETVSSRREQFNPRPPPAKIKISSQYQLRSSIRSLRTMLDEFPNSNESVESEEEEVCTALLDSFETPALTEPCLISPPALEAVTKSRISFIERGLDGIGPPPLYPPT